MNLDMYRNRVGTPTALLVATGLLALAAAGCSHSSTDSAKTSGDRMVATLRNLLPSAQLSQQLGKGPSKDSPSLAQGQLVYDDGHGAAAIAVSVARLPTPIPLSASACPDLAYNPYDQCTEKHLPGNSVLTIDKGYANPLDKSGIKYWSAMLTTESGEQTVVQEWNAASSTAPKPSRAQPPLTTQQLQDLASAKPWGVPLSALAVPRASGPPPSTPVLAEARIESIMKDRLPSSLKLADRGGVQGYLSLTVNDGHGKALMSVSVQQWQPGDLNMNSLFAKAGTLSNGTKVVTRKEAVPDGAPGTVQWEADTFRTNGYRVLITELNADAVGLPPTRISPPLSTDQLATMALDPSWTTRR